MTRPNKDEYYMAIAREVSTRSFGMQTKIGCIAIDQEGGILSTGYNGPPMGVNDKIIPLTRPEKYLYMIHSEQNCICTAARNGNSLRGCTFYVTVIPCPTCLRMMYQVGAEEIVMSTYEAKTTKDEWHTLVRFLNPYIRIRKIVL